MERNIPGPFRAVFGWQTCRRMGLEASFSTRDGSLIQDMSVSTSRHGRVRLLACRPSLSRPATHAFSLVRPQKRLVFELLELPSAVETACCWVLASLCGHCRLYLFTFLRTAVTALPVSNCFFPLCGSLLPSLSGYFSEFWVGSRGAVHHRPGPVLQPLYLAGAFSTPPLSTPFSSVSSVS